ncbi:MAG: hypothetical protein R2795_09775 [Saprospiraceae bacterium]
MAATLKAIPARYLRITATNYGIIPSGRQGAGNAAWLFVDEVVVDKAGMGCGDGFAGHRVFRSIPALGRGSATPAQPCSLRRAHGFAIRIR